MILASFLILISVLGFSDSFAEEIKNKKLPVLFEQFFYFFDYETKDGVSLTELRTSKTSIIMILESRNEGTLRVNLPPDLIKNRYKCVDGGSGDIFVIIDGIEVEAKKIDNNENANIVYDIFLQKGNFEVEIIFPADQGSWAFPEGCPIKFFPNAIFYNPVKQLEKGLDPSEIICREGLKLIFKSSNDSPACVKPESIPKLIERGWANSEKNKERMEILNNSKLSKNMAYVLAYGHWPSQPDCRPFDKLIQVQIHLDHKFLEKPFPLPIDIELTHMAPSGNDTIARVKVSPEQILEISELDLVKRITFLDTRTHC